MLTMVPHISSTRRTTRSIVCSDAGFVARTLRLQRLLLQVRPGLLADVLRALVVVRHLDRVDRGDLLALHGDANLHGAVAVVDRIAVVRCCCGRRTGCRWR